MRVANCYVLLSLTTCLFAHLLTCWTNKNLTFLAAFEVGAALSCKWRKVIKEVRWPGWVWAGECFFWYWPTRVVPDKRPLNGCWNGLSVCLCVCMYVCPGVCVYVACYLCLSVQGYVAWSEIYPQHPETRLLRAELRTHYDLLMRLLQICCLLVTLHFTVYSSTCMLHSTVYSSTCVLHSTVYSGCAFDTVGCCPGQRAIKRVCVYTLCLKKNKTLNSCP